MTKHHSSYSTQVGDRYYESNIQSRVIDIEQQWLNQLNNETNKRRNNRRNTKFVG